MELVEIKKLLEKHYPDYEIKKIKPVQPKQQIGIETLDENGLLNIHNPISGHVYNFETGYDLRKIAEQKKWCGQFAGKKQWAQIGRKIVDDDPYIFLSIYKKEIKLYALEQTDEN